MVQISEDTLKACKEYLVKRSVTWAQSGGVCAGTCVPLNWDGKNPNVILEAHTACHAWVTYGYNRMCHPGGSTWNQPWNRKYTEKSKTFLVLSCHSRDAAVGCTKEASDFLVLWVARESPFSQYILNRDDEESLTKGGVILLCGPDGLPQAQAMWVCKVLRFITEGGKAADTFMTLCKGGVDPMLAVYIASHIRTVKGATFGYTGPETHSTVFERKYGENVPIEIAGLVQRNLNPDAPSTQTVFKTIPGTKLDNKLTTSPEMKVQSFCKPFEKDDGWGGKIKGEGVDADALVKRALEWEKDLKVCLRLDPVPEPAFIPLGMPDSNTVYLELDL
jgi:hypothetical protein